MKKITLLFLLVILISSAIKAQSKSMAGIFPTIDHSGALSKKLEYSLYYFIALPLANFKQPKLSRDAHFLLFYSEQALSYHLNKNLSFTLSYVFQRENPLSANYINENRVYIQTTYKHDFKNAKIKHRLRFDNRFFYKKDLDTIIYAHRLRYLIGVEMPIKCKKNNLYFTAYEEAFFNTYKNAGKVFAENWATAAIGIKLNKIHKIEAGPLFITWNTGGRHWFNQYYLQLTWISHLDFKKG